MAGKIVGRALAGIVKGLLGFVVSLVVGLLKGLSSPFVKAGRTAKTKWNRKRDTRALKRDWKALKAGKLGKRGKNLGSRTRKRIRKRVA